MKSILETCTPRPDILRGTFNPEVFTASLGQVMAHYRGGGGTLDTIYTDAEPFFHDATYPTDGMRTVVSEVLTRLAGDGSVPAVHRLETAFGGGKTHTLIALVHLALKGRDISPLVGDLLVPDVFDAARLHAPGEIAVVGVAGDEIPVHEAKGKALEPYTLWGEIAYQVGGEALYRELESDVTSHAAPGRAYFERVFAGRRVLILLDELAQYATRLSAARPTGAEELAAFLMPLLGYARSRPGLSVVVTLAGGSNAFAQQTRRLADLIGQVRGQEVSQEEALGMALAARGEVASVVARDESVTTPVQAGEIARVLAKRLFVQVDPDGARAAADAYLEMYGKSGSLLPERATRTDFRQELVDRYPFHPTFVDFLNRKMASLETFQGTRGVLRVLALTVRNLWSRREAVPMIHTSHVDLRDARLVNEIFGRGGASDLLPALNTDVGGVDTGTLSAGVSRAQLADHRNPHPAGYPLHEYTWKVVLLHSLVGRAEGLQSNLFGLNESDALFEVAFPGLTPPQVETALKEVENSAFFLRYSREHGRYYASLDASINRALADIRGGLRDEQAREHLAGVVRSAFKSEGTFRVVHDVSLPEHVPDRTDHATLALISLDASRIDGEAFVTTAGPNRPRIQQNLVFLLVPRTVHVQGEIWTEERVLRAQDAWSRLLELAREVIARRRLRDQPESFGLKAKQLADEEFDRKSKERELALLTTLTELYDSVWFPGSSGQVIRKEIHAGVGQVLGQIHQVLDQEGELVTAARVATQESLLSLGKLLFQSEPTPSLEKLRETFKVNRRWPVLESGGVFDTLVREGVGRGYWCLFRLASETSIKPESLYGREDPLPLDLDLSARGWALVSPEGARQRGWLGGATVDPSKVEGWIRDLAAEQPVAYVSELVQKVAERHGAVPEKAVLAAIDTLVRSDALATFTGTPERTEAPARLVHGAGAILHQVQPGDVLITPAEAARRGWIAAPSRHFELQGREAADRLVPLLGRIGSLYAKGAKSRVAVLDLGGLEVKGGGQLRILLQDVPPAGMKGLQELLEVLAGITAKGPATQGMLRVEDPADDCLFLNELKKG